MKTKNKLLRQRTAPKEAVDTMLRSFQSDPMGILPEPPAKLYTPSEVEQARAEQPVLAETLDWLWHFLARPHPDLGRRGSVCPYIVQALNQETVWMAVLQMERPSTGQIEEAMSRFREVFLNLEPREGEGIIEKALMAIFPDVPAERAPELVDQVQRQLKPIYTRSGLMLGEFHRYNETPGLRNEAFRPLRSPYPMLVIRHMVETDLPFLMRDTDSPKVRMGFLKAYLRRLGGVVSEGKLDTAIQAMVQAELEERGIPYEDW